MRQITIGSRIISEREPCYVIAEIGVNHNGSLGLAHKMIDSARESGADAVKFQTFKTDANILSDAPKAQYQQAQTGDGSQRDMVAKLELPFEAFTELKAHCDEVGIDFITTAFDRDALEFVIGLEPQCLKWPSGEITNIQLLRQAACSGLPVLLSTGMASLAEIDTAVAILEPQCPLAILQCVSNYPARIEDQNLRAIPALAAAFDCPVGLSDHTLGAVAVYAARALGMAVLEKHVTLDRKMDGPDHAASMEADEFAAMVERLRALEVGLGDGVKRPVDDELDTRRVARKSLVYARDLEAGSVLGDVDVTAKRPGTGLGAEHVDLVLGKALRRAVTSDQYVELGDLEAEDGE